MYNCSILVKGTLNLHSNSIPLVISISWGKISSQQMANVKTGGKNWSCLPFCGLYLVHENVYYRKIINTFLNSKTIKNWNVYQHCIQYFSYRVVERSITTNRRRTTRVVYQHGWFQGTEWHVFYFSVITWWVTIIVFISVKSGKW